MLPAPPLPGAIAPTSTRDRLPAPPPRGATAIASALVMAALAVGLALRGRPSPFARLDAPWVRWAEHSGNGATTDFADALDRLGGPIGAVVPLTLVGVLCVYGRWRSGLFAFTAAVLTNFVVVMPLKQVVDRPRPPHPLVLVNDGSFPSGQVFSAVTLVMVAAVVAFPPRVRRWWWLFGGVYVAAMMWSRTWLHAQWFSDTAAGALAGAGTCLLLWRAFAPLLEREAVRAAAVRLF
ncbi:phosphatase PAP2 family protein [Streptomyces sp. ASQP_92]|uniref:phosphatase PAP2 family protein n=1 Tax=Streptomyces sp. ASQP_92 TaxID=2979116 RepID=UPI0021BF25FB|nr:phosphatase PAP2 family protein [Streptomyces sp. ASQP_92]MCT9088943.1 phosphatase PAP2 family protein [Streptomyces sp. ASQP_92]